MGEATQCVGVTAGIAPHLRENKSVSSTIATWVVVRMIARPSEHTCVSSVWNRIAQWSVLVTRGGRHPKVRVRGSTRASGEFVRCDPGQGAKRPLDTGVESVMVDSKNFESCVAS